MYSNIPEDFSGDDEEEGEEYGMDVDDDQNMANDHSLTLSATMKATVDGDTSTVTQPSSSSTEVDEPEENFDDALHRLEAADDLARSIHVERSFLLSSKLSLREYQQTGLNWLVSLHERRLNGILADEMGLGKTIQTIAMLAHLATYKGIWGPHLIVVPTSCIVNWEAEFKKWCPIFKILTYYGSSKARTDLRRGWMTLNSFHVCITSYQLVVQDANSFKRKRWYYLVLDEAHNIKNFKSKRWQTLLNFNTQRRLLLTGTPLQNNLMELWSLLHFLMPHLFRSRKEFSYWFSNPLNNMVEGNRGINNDLISRLHSIMRPFLLRRLKKDVAKQLPGKYEHILTCKLSKRQLFLYEEFISRSTTRSLLSGGNFMGMMNVLMQLRKVCNHPDLFEPRPIVSPFRSEEISYPVSRIVMEALDKSPIDFLSDHMTRFWSYGECTFVRTELKRLKVSKVDFLEVEDICGPWTRPARLMDPKYDEFLEKWNAKVNGLYRAQVAFNYYISSFRCNAPKIDYDQSVTNLLEIPLPTTLAVQAKHDNRVNQRVSSVLKSMIKSVDERAWDLDEIIKHAVFTIPTVWSRGVRLVTSLPDVLSNRRREAQCNLIKPVYEKAVSPLYSAAIRQKIFFPDRKLVQFDSGKLNTLAELLRERKAGGHKCLIFTQMSKMLDVLEVFLNLYGYTYVRLDGATGVDTRQRLMDRFNSDPKLFIFILSTRSGGLGINLTGADTVIFYDSDWNPAMDAQAQDRAHRIGQTKDVHIYRLVCGSTVEENILIKAKQKQHLDHLVMTEGNFSAENIAGDAKTSSGSMFTASGLQDILGISKGLSNDAPVEELESNTTIEAAMAAVEDEDDLNAMRGATKEAAQENAEFDDNAPIEMADNLDNADGGSEVSKGPGRPISSPTKSTEEKAEQEEKDMEAEFASWQEKVGPDFKSIEASLNGIERYAINFHTEIEPYYSVYFLSQQQIQASLEENVQGEEWDVEQIEREKEEEEYRMLAEGEYLSANMKSNEIDRLKKWYVKERLNRYRKRRFRILSGAGWTNMIDATTGFPFWYNEDTGEASYGLPKEIEAKEIYHSALEKGFAGLPLRVLTVIFSFLLPYPDRMNAARVCTTWRQSSKQGVLFKKVYSVESGARNGDSNIAKGHNEFASLEAAVATLVPGDTLVLCNGHHWEGDIVIDVPVRICSESNDPSRCIVELTGSLKMVGPTNRCLFNGITIRRPRKVEKRSPCIVISDGAKLALASCTVNNEGAYGAVISASKLAKLHIYETMVKCGTSAGITGVDCIVMAAYSKIVDNLGYGIVALRSIIYAEDCYVMRNGKEQIHLAGKSGLMLAFCEVRSSSEESMTGRETDKMNDTTTKKRIFLGNDCLVQIKHCSGDSKFLNEISKFASWKLEKSNKKQRISFSCPSGKMGISKKGKSNDGIKVEPKLEPIDNLPVLNDTNISSIPVHGNAAFVPLSASLGIHGDDKACANTIPETDAPASGLESHANVVELAPTVSVLNSMEAIPSDTSATNVDIPGEPMVFAQATSASNHHLNTPVDAHLSTPMHTAANVHDISSSFDGVSSSLVPDHNHVNNIEEKAKEGNFVSSAGASL